MNIRKRINEFTDFALDGTHQENSLQDLIKKLDELPFLLYSSEFEFDEKDYPDPPEIEYQKIRKQIELKFPELGYYKIPEFDEYSLESTGELIVGDAIDDVTDIVIDLLEIEWFFQNTSEADALWHLDTSYRAHWGKHLRELQLYLYRQHY